MYIIFSCYIFVAFSFLQIFKCLAFFTKCFVGVFLFPCNQHFKNEQYHNVNKKQAKEHTPASGQFQGIKGFEHFNIRLKHSKI